MEVDTSTQNLIVPVAHAADAGEGRRRAAALAASIGFEDLDQGRVALVATELGTNLAKHAPGKGKLLLRVLRLGSRRGVELLSLDSGPGFDSASGLRDGHSTAGTRGVGLGAVARIADVVDFWSAPGRGSAVLAQVFAGPSEVLRPGIRCTAGAVSVALQGETVCGDDWGVQYEGGRARALVADGLGHGKEAAIAARRAVEFFDSDARLPLDALMRSIHSALRGTRGAAVALAEFDAYRGVFRFTGIGNVSGALFQATRVGLASVNGTAGAEPRTARVLEYPLQPGALLVLHSDGIDTHWNLDTFPGLRLRHPSLVSSLLFREHARARDDATTVVVRYDGTE